MIDPIKFFAPALIFSLLYITCCTKKKTTSLGSLTFTVSFEEKQVIAEQELSMDDFLTLPASQIREEGKGQIRVDDQGYIYLPDHRAVTIRVFDDKGRYVRNIGSRGNGPGEFERIGAIEVFGNFLTVYDAGNQRLVQFTTQGRPLAVEPMEGQPLVFPVSLHQPEDGRYLFLHKLPANQSSTDESSIDLMHVFEPDSSKSPVSSFASADSLVNINTKFVDKYISEINTGRVWLENGDLWLVPGIYEGKIYHYKEQNGQWLFDQLLEGSLLAEFPVLPDTDQSNTIKIVTYFPQQEMFSGTLISNSLGIFQMSDGRVVHISSQLMDDQRNTIIEAFNQEGELEGTGNLKEFTFPADEKGPLIGPFWKDQNDLFYFVDYRKKDPVLRVGKILGI